MSDSDSDSWTLDAYKSHSKKHLTVCTVMKKPHLHYKWLRLWAFLSFFFFFASVNPSFFAIGSISLDNDLPHNFSVLSGYYCQGYRTTHVERGSTTPQEICLLAGNSNLHNSLSNSDKQHKQFSPHHQTSPHYHSALTQSLLPRRMCDVPHLL